jgi:hypothetical protein
MADVDTSAFPIVDDFAVCLRNTERFGNHIHLIDRKRGTVAGFWRWDHADLKVRRMETAGIPLGSRTGPFHDAGQGWEIIIWEHLEDVYVMEGPFDEEPRHFYSWFRVPKKNYLAAWQVAIDEARANPQTFDLFEEALVSPERVKALSMGNQGLTRLPDEIGRFENLESLTLYLNKLHTLPETIGSLKKLRWIDLRFNRIERLPKSFCALLALESINLAENQLREIPRCVARLRKLKSFYIVQNPVAVRSRLQFKTMRRDVEIGRY